MSFLLPPNARPLPLADVADLRVRGVPLGVGTLVQLADGTWVKIVAVRAPVGAPVEVYTEPGQPIPPKG